MNNPHEAPQLKPSETGMLSRFLWMPLVVTFIVGLLLLSMEQNRLSHAWKQFVTSFIYSVLIALPSILLLTRVSVRYTARFPRLIYLFQALILAGTTSFGCLSGGLLLRLIGFTQQGFYWREFWTAFPFSLIISLISGLSISAYEALRYKLQAAVLELRTREVERERAYKLLAEARLSSLESRIHPHFLFNTLNSIASLIPDNPKRAEAMVGRLASLLRFSLNANHCGLVPLSQELKIVHDYLEIEQARFGARLRYAVDIPSAVDAAEVPPLALQSLVENCIKHVIAQRQQGGSIRVSGFLDLGHVVLEVSDDGPGFDLPSISPNHGLANLMARMSLLFGEAGYLEVSQNNGQNNVRLHFPTRQDVEDANG
jgi:sensor histidine kinase YesM